MKNIGNMSRHFLIFVLMIACQGITDSLKAQGCCGNGFMFDGGPLYWGGNPQQHLCCPVVYGPDSTPCGDTCMGSQAGFTSFVPVVQFEGVFGETVGLNDDYISLATQIYTNFGPDPDISFITTFKAHMLFNHGHLRFASNIG